MAVIYKEDPVQRESPTLWMGVAIDLILLIYDNNNTVKFQEISICNASICKSDSANSVDSLKTPQCSLNIQMLDLTTRPVV